MSPHVAPLILLLLPAFAAAYVRYSDAYIGTPIACTSEEKFCFRYNLLYNAELGKCVPLYSRCSQDEVLVVNKEELTGAEPKLKARCGAARCLKHLESYFWPRGECLEPAAADVQCEGSSRTLNMFGEWECWCAPSTNVTHGTSGTISTSDTNGIISTNSANGTNSTNSTNDTNITNDTNSTNDTNGANSTKHTSGAPCPAPVVLPQPVEDGRCVVPNLFEPYARQDTVSAAGPCTEEEFHCYNRSQVLFQGQCVTPLQRGPCAESEWVVLASGPPLKATCAPRRCPHEHHVWIDAPNLEMQPHCQPQEDVRKLLCLDHEDLVVDALGYGKCAEQGSTPQFQLPNNRENGLCRVINTPPQLVPPVNVAQQIVPSDAMPSVPPSLPQLPSTTPPSTFTIVLSPGTTTSSPSTESLVTSTHSPVVMIPESSTPSPATSPASTSEIVQSPRISTHFPLEVLNPATPTPSPVVIRPEASTPLSVASFPSTSQTVLGTGASSSPPVEISPATSTASPAALSPEISTPSGTTSSVVGTEAAQQPLVDTQPCVKPACPILPDISSFPNTQQALSHDISVPTVLGSVDISTPPTTTITTSETLQVRKEQLVSQLDSSPPGHTPVDLRIAQQPLSVIIQTPSTDLLAPEVTSPEQQLAGVEPEPVIESRTINETASPAILQNQTNSETVTSAQVPAYLTVSHPSDQQLTTLGKQVPTVPTQQIVEQSQQFPHAGSNSQLVPGAVTQAFPTIFRESVAPVAPQQKVLLEGGTPVTMPESPVISQLAGQGQDHVIGGSVQFQPANILATSVPSSNVGPSVQSENVLISQIPQQNVDSNFPPNTVQIIRNDPSVSSVPQANGLPFVTVQPSTGNIPLVSLHSEQNNYSSDLVQNPPEEIPTSQVQTRRQDGVVEYVLLGQNNVPVNSV